MNRIIFFTLFIAMVTAGCNKTLSNNNLGKSPDSITPSTTYTNPPQAQFDTSTWKVYSDSHIIFRYPSTWNIKAQETNNGITSLSLYNTKQNYYLEGSIISPINIDYQTDSFKGSINTYIGQSKVQFIQQNRVKIDGKDAYIIQSQGNIATGLPEINDRVVFYNNLVYDIISKANIIGAADSKTSQIEIAKIFDTILTTIQFH